MSKALRPVLRHGLRRGLASTAGFSRRDVLKRASGAAAAFAAGPALGILGGCESSRRTRTRAGATGEPPLRVAVIGAGLAGLACADTLIRNGAWAVVFEATGRPGGRVLTNRQFVSGKNVEFGAEFIGMNQPTWLAYARRFGLALVPAVEYEGEEAILLNGRLIRGERADALYTQTDETLAKLIELARPIDPVRPWTSPNATRLDHTSYAQFLAEANLGADARELLSTVSEADNGVPAARQSLLAMLSMIAGGGFRDYFEISETHRAAAGNDALPRAMANWLNASIRYNAAVLSVTRTPTHAVVHASRGEPVECDAVVLAVPPSVWHKIVFDNPFRQRVPQMGKNVKLITKVSHPVWEQQKLTPELVSDGLVHLTWVSAENDPGLPKSFTLFSGGRRAEELRNLDRKERTKRAVESLRAAYPTLEGAVMEDRFMDWPGVPTALASYSFPAPGEVTRYGPTLVDGPPDDGGVPLRFAGEHTSYGFIGYMEGALQSGARVAEALLARADASRRRRPEPATATVAVG